MAMAFEIDPLSTMEQPIIIAVSSGWAKRFAGGLQLSATPATCYYLNPPLPEAEHIRQLYNELLGPDIPLALPPRESAGIPTGRPPAVLSLNSLLNMNPETHMEQIFTIAAVIMKIDESKGWWLNRCCRCHMRISEGIPHGQCQQPGTKPSPNYSYCFKVVLADTIGSSIVTCFSPEAESFLPTCSDVLSYTPDPDTYVLPSIIRALENTKHVFRIRYATGSRRGYPKFILYSAGDTLPPLLTGVAKKVLKEHPHCQHHRSFTRPYQLKSQSGP